MTAVEPTEAARTPTPPVVEEEQSAFDFLEHAFHEQDPFTVNASDLDSQYDEIIPNIIPDEQSVRRGKYLYNTRGRSTRVH